MKLPIQWSELALLAIAGAVFVITYVPLGRLTGASSVPTTIKDLLLLYVLYLCISITFCCLKNLWRKKSSAQPEAQ